MVYDFRVPESKKIRAIIDTDAKNEADDQFAIVHHLLTPKFKVKGSLALILRRNWMKAKNSRWKRATRK